jgi:hypothetical protein
MINHNFVSFFKEIIMQYLFIKNILLASFYGLIVLVSSLSCIAQQSASTPPPVSQPMVKIMIWSNDIDKVSMQVNNPRLRAILQQAQIPPQAIRRAYPNFQERDTLFTNERGKKLRVTNYAKYFTIILPRERLSNIVRSLDSIGIYATVQ